VQRAWNRFHITIAIFAASVGSPQRSLKILIPSFDILEQFRPDGPECIFANQAPYPQEL
jgi:hypothetical protein